MHKRNIVNRDIKPENILISLDEDGDQLNIKLTDFGFACVHDENEGLDTVLGSPFYMAPELVKRKNYGPGVDVWAVGVIAHTLLTGCVPFDGTTKTQIKASILRDKPGFGGLKSALSTKAINFVN